MNQDVSRISKFSSQLNMRNIVKTNVCSPLTGTFRWAIMAWGSRAVQDTWKHQHWQDLPWSLVLFSILLKETGQRSSWQNFLKPPSFTTSMPGEMRTYMMGLYNPTKTSCVVYKRTWQVLASLPSQWSMGWEDKKKYSVKAQICTLRNRKADKNKPGSDSHIFTSEGRICWPC